MSQKARALILIVDDDEDIRFLLENELFKNGFTLSVASNGEHALEILKKRPRYDLIITDYKMHGMSGAELCGEIRKLSITVPVIMVTGFASDDVLKEAETVGIQKVIEKPIRPSQLVLEILDLLDQPKKPTLVKASGE